MPSQQQTSKTPIAIRDSWQTPQWLFDWADCRFNLDFDLAASKDNAKCDRYFDVDSNSLEQDWREGISFGWCNPPYSETGKWVEKACQESKKGARVALLIPAFNGESCWKYIYHHAPLVISIIGRISFVTSTDFVQKGSNEKHYKAGDEVSGNTRGSCLVVFHRRFEGQTITEAVDRDTIKKGFDNSDD